MMRLDSRISHSAGSLSWQLARRVRWKGTFTALSTSTAGALQVYLRRRRREHMLTSSHRDGLAGITERHPDLNVYDESPSDHAHGRHLQMGCYQEGIAKDSVGGKYVTAHIFE